MENIEIDFNPNFEDLTQIRNWASHLDSNWSTIFQSFNNKELIIAKCQNQVVSYFACQKDCATIFISLAETKLEFQKKGIANKILNRLTDKFKNSELKAFFLYCSPEESQYYWKKTGFEYCPNAYDKNRIYMYKIFGEVKYPQKYSDKKPINYIEIWDEEWPSQNEKPKWICELEFKKGTKELLKPIMFFGNYNWHINIVQDKHSRKMRYKELDRNNEIYDYFYIKSI